MLFTSKDRTNFESLQQSAIYIINRYSGPTQRLDRTNQSCRYKIKSHSLTLLKFLD